jgi:16S rRNA (adenine1518-N6/adenine1519-N6)-dimethyltransferase
MSVLEETKFIMNKYDVHPSKSFGQNFLIDENALDLIASDVNKDDVIVEIGPGLGTLTAILAEKAKKVYAVELDKRMVAILKDRFMLYKNIEIINEDILKVDINSLDKNIKVVANLPYYITTQIVTSLLDAKVGDITILIQKEVADRICAKPGDKDAGAITYLVNYYADCEFKGIVSKECFIPSPKVESAVVNIKRLDKPRVKVNDEKLFFEIIKANFSQRRKTIINSLSNLINKNDFVKILEELNIPVNVRGENLTIEQFAAIANKVSEIKKK